MKLEGLPAPRRRLLPALLCAFILATPLLDAALPEHRAAVMAQTPSATPEPVIPIVPTAAPTDEPPPSNPTAMALLQRSDEAMNRLTGMREEIKREPEATRVAVARYAAPDRMEFKGYSGDWLESHSIVIGADRWHLYGFTENRSWTYDRSRFAYRWPSYHRGHYEKRVWMEAPVSVQLEGQERFDGRMTWRLSYMRRYESDHGGWITEYWREWIDQENHRLLRSQVHDDDSWGEAGTVYTRHYSAFDEPVDIVWPAEFAPFREYMPLLRWAGR